jgi:hypothetical protein
VLLPVAVAVAGMSARWRVPSWRFMEVRSGGDNWLTYESFARTVLETGSLEGRGRLLLSAVLPLREVSAANAVGRSRFSDAHGHERRALRGRAGHDGKPGNSSVRADDRPTALCRTVLAAGGRHRSGGCSGSTSG